MATVTFQDRVRWHLQNQPTPRPSKNGGKGSKPSRKRNMSQALRYARAAARKDVRVSRDSNGLFENTAEAVQYSTMNAADRLSFRASRGFTGVAA